MSEKATETAAPSTAVVAELAPLPKAISLRPPTVAAPLSVAGVLEIMEKGYGFLRDGQRDLRRSELDPFVALELIRAYRLRSGQHVRGPMRRGDRGGAQLASVAAIQDAPIEHWRPRRSFEELATVEPTRQLRLELGPAAPANRVLDLLLPIGRGQCGLIAAPPRAGKTVLLQQIAAGLAVNHPDVHVMLLLVDQRPEEVTELKRSVAAEVLASRSDLDIAEHVRLARLGLDRAKRLVEAGSDVVLLIDGLTRLARAFLASAGSGRALSAGVDARALEELHRLLAAARCTEDAGSLTILATCLADTGRRADELIFEELRVGGQLELTLDRRLAAQRLFPALNLARCVARRAEKLLSPGVLAQTNLLRRTLSSMPPAEGLTSLLRTLSRYESNRQFLEALPRVPTDR